MDYTDIGKFEIIMEEDLKIPTPEELAEVHIKALGTEVSDILAGVVKQMNNLFNAGQVLTVKIANYRSDKAVQEVQKKLLDKGWSSKASGGGSVDYELEIRPVSKR